MSFTHVGLYKQLGVKHIGYPGEVDRLPSSNQQFFLFFSREKKNPL